MTFTFQAKDIPEVISIKCERHSDERGFFEETFKSSVFKSNGMDFDFVQDNHSYSTKGVIRGLHFQIPPKEQGKLVSVISGEIFDVAVDVRPNSRYFGRWISEILSADNHKMLWIPPGFAHGFFALQDSHVVYKTTSEYSFVHERGILWDDQDIGVVWPEDNPIVSEKDRKLMTFATYKKEMEMIRK